MNRANLRTPTSLRAFAPLRVCVASLLLGCAVWAADAPLRVCLLSGSRQYRSDDSLRGLQRELEEDYGAVCLWAQGKDQGKTIKGLDALDKCDVLVIFIRRMTLSDQQLKRIQDYCDAGKPIVGIRTASHAIQNWLAFDKLVLGGSYSGHWGGREAKVTFTQAGQSHAILQDVGRFSAYGGIYQNPKLAKDATVLATASEAGHSAPVAWCRPHKGGRVFYTSLGTPEDFGDKHFRRMLMNAIFWAAGRQPVRIERSPEDMRARALAKLKTYKFGDSRKPFAQIEKQVAEAGADPQMRQQVCHGLIGLLESDASVGCKRFVCRQLGLVGHADAVPALAMLLAHKDLASPARLALERIPGPEAQAALRDALGRAKGAHRIGLINSIGRRGGAKAVPMLVKLLNQPDTADAAAQALAAVGGAAAAKALAGAVQTPAVVDARLRCAASGEPEKAAKTCRAIYASKQPTYLRVAALNGLADALGEKAGPTVVEALTGADAALRAAARKLVRTMPGKGLAALFAAQLPQLAPGRQVELVDALAGRGDKAAHDAVLAAAKSQDERVRAAVWRALLRLGSEADIPCLAQAAVSKSPSEAAAARRTLNRLPGAAVDQAILDCMAQSDAKAQAMLIACLAERRASAALPMLLKAAKDVDRSVRKEAFKALGVLADEKALPRFVSLVLEAKPGSEMDAAQKALAQACRRAPDPARRAAPVLAAIQGADTVARCCLLRVLGRIGSADAKKVVLAALGDQDPQVQDAAVRALCDWPDASAAQDLLALARDGHDMVHQVLALRGYVRVVGLPARRQGKAIVRLLEDGMKAARRVDERKLVLSAAAKIKDLAAADMVKRYLDDKELHAEAEAAIVKIANSLRRSKSARKELKPLVKRVASQTSTDRIRGDAQKWLDKYGK